MQIDFRRLSRIIETSRRLNPPIIVSRADVVCAMEKRSKDARSMIPPI